MDKTIYLCIAGHGPYTEKGVKRFDPGATGFIKKGEYRYMKDDLFPAMKKYADDKFVFFDKYNVYGHRNIVALARSYGLNVVVIEFHFDGISSPQASRGHVIVYSHYKPDAMDLRLRDVIKDMVGVRYNHAGEVGISGRSNLFNVNAAASGGVNYRLVELGFGTNKRDADILMNKTDEYAKKLVEAIKGAKVDKVSTPIPPREPSPKKSISDMADEVEGMLHGTGHGNRQKSLRVDNATYAKVRAEVNRRAGVTSKPKPKPKPKKTINQMAQEVRAGKHGTGHENRRASLKVSQSEYNRVRAEVNRLEGVKTAPAFNAQSIANQIKKGGIDSSGRRIPNGHNNRQRHFNLTNSQYQQVRRLVNR